MGIFTRMWAFVAGRPKARRSYDAASGAARFGDFSKSNLSANAELDLALVTLRNRARGLHRNEPFVRRWISQLKTNVVGEKGFVYRCRAKNDNGGIDRFGNDMIESLWKPWAKVVTADGIMCWEEFLAMAVETWGRDGEFFVEKVRLKQAKYSYALHPFEADLVDETYSRSARAGENEIRQGVEIDGFGRPIAYHVLTEHPGETVYGQRHAYKRRRRILADKIIHVFIKSRPGQVRGEPPMSAVMTSTKMLSGYREAEVTGRRLAASKMGFFKRMFQSGSGDIAPLADVETKDGILEMEVEPGKLSALPPGVEFEKFDMQTFSTDYEQFERQILRSISAGLDISYSNISMDSSNSSYSSDRSEQIKQRDIWRMLQMFFIRRLAEPIVDDWLDIIFFERYISFPVGRLEKFRAGSRLQPRGWAWVDPQKEIQAALDSRAAGLVSLTHIAAEQGRDLSDVFAEIAAEEELAADMGVTLTFSDKPDTETVEQTAVTE